MNPDQFVSKWKAATLKERSAAQEHFTDLCRLLDEPTPAEADPNGEWFCFEKGAGKAGGGDGWADVWRRGCFGWEYKGKGKDLQRAFKQLQLYSPALEYPPLLIVSDIDSIVIHTAFTGMVPEVHVLTLDDLADASKRRVLKWAFTEPQRLRPDKAVASLTEEAAGRFAHLATELRERGHEPKAVAHFLNRILFCLFAEDVDLLPRQMFRNRNLLTYAPLRSSRNGAIIPCWQKRIKEDAHVLLEICRHFSPRFIDLIDDMNERLESR
jgi:hypothetical protein